jgi:hypothetical protein
MDKWWYTPFSDTPIWSQNYWQNELVASELDTQNQHLHLKKHKI